MKKNDDKYIEVYNDLNNQLIRRIEKTGLTVRYLTPEQEKDLSLLAQGKENTIVDRQMITVPELMYSNAENTVQNIKQDKATPVQWLAMLQKAGGIKAGEDRWLGLSQWLSDCKELSLTKNEVLQYINDHRIVLHEDAYGEVESMEDYKALNEEFQKRVNEADVLWREADKRLEEFLEEMKVKYEEDWEYLMRDDERQRHEELDRERDRYDDAVYDQYERAFEDMVTEHGSSFDTTFGYENENLVVVDEDAARRFLYDGIINGQRLEFTTTGLVNYRELALWSENAKTWDENDMIHFGEVGKGRCIGWIRFGETAVQNPMTTEEYQQMLADMPKEDAWIKQDGSKFVNGNDLYYPPSWHNPYLKSEFIAEDKKNGCFVYYPLNGVPKTFPSLQKAVEHYNREHAPQTKEQKVLIIDEIQSSRHQEGREKGYQLMDKEFEEMIAAYNTVNEKKAAFQNSMREKYNSEFFGHYMTEEEQGQLGALEEQLRQFGKEALDNSQRIPAAPFEKNWHELCMKRMLRYAAEKGYDKIAWTTGEQQVKRYNLAKIVQTIERDRNYMDDKYIRISYNHDSETGFYVKPDGIIYDSVIGLNGKHIRDVLGKELAEKVMTLQVGEKLDAGDVNIGNKGMTTFYDRILPQFMNKYGKKWGVQVETLTLPNLSRANDFMTEQLTMHSIDVTPAMKESVMRGQPMFMLDKQGQLVGCAVDDTIFLTRRGINPETLVHEYTHIWARAMQQGNPEGWQSIKNLLIGTAIWDEVANDMLYQDLKGNEDRIASEALARISGRDNAGELLTIARKTAARYVENGKKNLVHDIFERLHTALQTFWSWVGRHMFDIGRFSSIEEVTDRVLYDLLDAQRLEHGKVLVTAPPIDNGRITHIHVFNGKGGQPYIRCKVDGVQQMGVPVKKQDSENIRDPELLHEIARRYFTDKLTRQENLSHAMKR